MNTIKTEFSRKGFHFRQIYRHGQFAVFERTRLPNFTQKHYETVRLKPFPAHFTFGRQFDAGEAYPSSEQWGSYGFTIPTESAALAKVEEMRNAFAEKPAKRP